MYIVYSILYIEAKSVGSVKKPPKRAAKTREAMHLMGKGYGPKEALIIATHNMNPHRNTVLDLKKKYATWSILHDKTQKKLKSVVDKVCDDYLETGENAGVAARVAGDGLKERAVRDHPIVNLNLNVNARSVSPVDLSAYRMARPGAVRGPSVDEGGEVQGGVRGEDASVVVEPPEASAMAGEAEDVGRKAVSVGPEGE